MNLQPIDELINGGHQFVGNPKEKILGRKYAPRLAVASHLFASGENVKVSGVYRIEHCSGHNGRIVKELFLRKDTTLPFCSLCKKALGFRLIERIDHITEDPDFQ